MLDQADVGRQVIPSVADCLTPIVSHTMADIKESHSDCAPIPPDVKEVLEKGDQSSVKYPD